MIERPIKRGPRHLPIALDLTTVADKAALVNRIQGVLRSVRFQLAEDGQAFFILGPDTLYHDADPLLAQGLEFIRPGLATTEIANYREMRGEIALCLEDCWSGWFLAPLLAQLDFGQDLILIHLDDHTDMMPTLLQQVHDSLIDPASGDVFDPACQEAWARSIGSGCVSIGNFITPLFYGRPRVHVRHLNNAELEISPVFDVRRALKRYDIIPDRLFATIDRTNVHASDGLGSYQVGSDASALLEDLPKGTVVVHVDFDYFINDFNGNVGDSQPLAPHVAQAAATPKLDAFFASLRHSDISVNQWILATSPGFCSGRHWRWLFEALAERIDCLSRNPRGQKDVDLAHGNQRRSISEGVGR